MNDSTPVIGAKTIAEHTYTATLTEYSKLKMQLKFAKFQAKQGNS